MIAKRVQVGNLSLQFESPEITGEFVEREGDVYFCIRNVDQMPPFLMSIVSPSDHWMFLSSTGSLTAGRVDANQALFPYYTDDKLHDSAETTGSKSVFLVTKGEQTFLWEPFSQRFGGAYRIERNLYKHKYGHRVVFEEINHDLGLGFSYEWKSGDRFGWIRQAKLSNLGDAITQVELLDGIQNILPPGLEVMMQNDRSNLMNAYKKSELLPESGVGLYSLSAIPVDRPEPSEALRATQVWKSGLEGADHLLCSRQLDRFRRGQSISSEVDIRAAQGAYFLHHSLELSAGASENWWIIIDGRKDGRQVANLTTWLGTNPDLVAELSADIDSGTKKLAEIVGSSDGLQKTGDRLSGARHFSNVLFNVMRGGTFWQNYQLPREDFVDFLEVHNQPIAEAWKAELAELPEVVDIRELWKQADTPQRRRLANEYLPLFFSRRHGDPSRPWNRFSIQTRDEQGNPRFYFEGNWRDIFQNWEALAWSYPGFIQSMISKFVNASTADGYNPYRITRKGIDWETLDPEDPWAYIGYWGDHQIIYLLKLMEVAWEREPAQLKQLLGEAQFSFAHVPYRIHPLEALLANPHETIDFDDDAEAEMEERVAKIGGDGKLIWDQQGQVYLVTLSEKLLITSLTKLSNLILEGGIWMNTQRPEWNDANNALVGYGISVVTLAYLRRFQTFCLDLFAEGEESFAMSIEVASWFRKSMEAIEELVGKVSGPVSNEFRLDALKQLGEPASEYRTQLYANGFSGETVEVKREELLRYFSESLHLIDHSLKANQREDHLYHSYNLLQTGGAKELSLRYLYEMLEGQVAILSSGLLSSTEALEVLDALKASALFREDHYSYLLYPNRDLPRFIQKNLIPAKALEEIGLFQQMLEAGDLRLLSRDDQGQAYFHGDMRNGKEVAARLDELAEESAYTAKVAADREAILNVFEKIFDHASFTGRSGTFFGYEGLGSIYWHMVSKLLLAVAENYVKAYEEKADADLLQRLVAHYYEIRAGIGLNKSPDLYGAFPTDPYSHTPAHKGAQQPGMTGQVKEDILSRWFELGVRVQHGEIFFDPILLRKLEFLDAVDSLEYVKLDGAMETLPLAVGTLGFTFCQVPIVYHLSDTPNIRLQLSDGQEVKIDGLHMGAAYSQEIFGRTGSIRQIEVGLQLVLKD